MRRFFQVATRNPISLLGVALTTATAVLFLSLLGLELVTIEEVPSESVRAAVFRAGAIRIELLEPLTPESPVAKSLDR